MRTSAKPALGARHGLRFAACALLIAYAIVGEPAVAQDANRQRAQLMQLQQQLQRLQQDSAQLQTERDKAQAEGQKLKKESSVARGELTAMRTRAAESAREVESLKSELAASRDALVAAKAEIEQLSKEVQGKDASLATAARLHREQEQGQVLLGERLKAQTGRADLCETKHAQAMQFAAGMVDRYEKDRLRLCEPVTGLWKVHAQNRIQELRDELSGYRLDSPAADSR